MAKKISDDELVEITGGTDGTIIDLDQTDVDSSKANLGTDRDTIGGVGGTGLNSDGSGGGGIQELG